MAFTTLITPQDLAPHLGDGDWQVFDCRHQLTDHGYGPRVYGEGHIPGAHYADMEARLSGPKLPGRGRHPLPEWDALAAWLTACGVGRASQVVAYDDNNGAFAARLWHLLRVLGHEAVAVLDGGLAAWRAAGQPTDSEAPSTRQRSGAPIGTQPLPGLLMHAPEISAELGRGGLLLVDARGPARYRGDEEPIDPVAGHIPGAINLPFMGNVNPDGTFLAAATLRERFLAAYGATPPGQSVHYCGSGVTACHNALAQSVAGLAMGRVYPGSWSEWCADPARPVAVGPHTPAERP